MAIAEKVTESYYEVDVKAMEKWGEQGRKKTLEDTVFTLQHLSSAVFANDVNLFLDYLKWLVVVLTSRRVNIDVIILHTQILIDTLDKEKMKAPKGNEKQILQKYVSYLKKGKLMLDQIKKNQKKNAIIQ
ncbi:MAG TPA: hypothetical protein VHF65_01690 [Nitrososphaera sp.]|nr:hypothetical protein [Nitrososphaera sp.]